MSRLQLKSPAILGFNIWVTELLIVLSGISGFILLSADESLSSRIIFLEDNWLSIGLSNNGLISSGIGFKANNICFGYSYGQQLNGEIVRYNYGSHELTLTFKLVSYNQKERTSFWY